MTIGKTPTRPPLFSSTGGFVSRIFSAAQSKSIFLPKRHPRLRRWCPDTEQPTNGIGRRAWCLAWFLSTSLTRQHICISDVARCRPVKPLLGPV